MSPRVVLVAGAGSLRSTAPTAAALAAFAPDHPVEIRLWDSDPEKLDLFDRFTRACVKSAGFGHAVMSTQNAVEAFDSCNAVIFTLTELSARRFLSPPPEAHEEAAPVEEPVVEAQPVNILEFGYGDRNRPTPRSRLSPSIRAMLHHPDLSLNREQALSMALDRLMLILPQRASVLNLMRGVDVPEMRGEKSDFPAPLSDEEMTAMPHQILRWIQGDEELARYIEECRRSPISRWLISL